MDRPLKIAMVVPGRFHAFDIARELLKQGHDVRIFTSDRVRVAEAFGLPRERVRSFAAYGLAARVSVRLGGLGRLAEPALHRTFGRWAAAAVRGERWDVLYLFSGIAEEALRAPLRGGELRAIVRGSAHVRVQSDILEEEERRVGHRIDRPSPWMIAREEREYALAEVIFVLSSFARRSFVGLGVPLEKIILQSMGTDLSCFRQGDPGVAARRARILSGRPLRVLTVGNFSFQKGALDYSSIVRRAGGRYEFRFVGYVMPETRAVASRTSAHFVPFQKQFALPAQYAWADVFLFPTLQDGYAVVLAQALAAGLPVLTTTNCSASDIVKEGESGWVLPIRSPEAFLDRLSRCDADREGLAHIAGGIQSSLAPHDWSVVAREFAASCWNAIDNRQRSAR